MPRRVRRVPGDDSLVPFSIVNLLRCSSRSVQLSPAGRGDVAARLRLPEGCVSRSSWRK